MDFSHYFCLSYQGTVCVCRGQSLICFPGYGVGRKAALASRSTINAELSGTDGCALKNRWPAHVEEILNTPVSVYIKWGQSTLPQWFLVRIKQCNIRKVTAWSRHLDQHGPVELSAMMVFYTLCWHVATWNVVVLTKYTKYYGLEMRCSPRAHVCSECKNIQRWDD